MGYKLLGLALLVGAVALGLNRNWVSMAFCAVLGLACLLGKVDRSGRRLDRNRNDDETKEF